MSEFKGTNGNLKLFTECFENEYNFYVQAISASSSNKILFANAYGKTKQVAEANAKLIACAPEMLNLLSSIENDENQVPKFLWDKIQLLIKKVTE